MLEKMILVICLIVMNFGQIYAKVVIKTAIDDAYIDLDAPDGYMGSWSPQCNYIKTYSGVNGGILKSRKSYIRFDISSIEREIIDAQLRFQIAQTNVSTWHEVGIYGLIDGTSGETTWTGNSITWNNAPANDTSSIYNFTSNAVYLGTVTIDSSKVIGDTFTYAVSQDFINFLKADTNGQVTIMLNSKIGTLQNVSFASIENPDYSPVKLIVKEAAQIVIDSPADDAYIDLDGPDGFMGLWSPQCDYIKTYAGMTSGVPKSRKSYLRFDLSSVKQKILGASLTFQIAQTNVSTWHDIGIYGLIDGATGETTWTDNGITWNNAPANDTSSIHDFTSDAVYLDKITVDSSKVVGDVFTYNVSQDFVNFLNDDSNKQVTIMLNSMLGTLQNVSFATNENSAYSPIKLTLDVSEKSKQFNLLVYLEDPQFQRWDEWEDFKPFVGYLDKSQNGTAQDWFFSNYCFLQYCGAPSGGDYFTGNCNKDDWIAFMDQLFTTGEAFEALDECIDQVALELNDPDHEDSNITIMLPYLLRNNTAFGDVDGDGQSENTSDPNDRIKIYEWYVDEMLQRWYAAGFKNLQLWGFYWMKEGIAHPNDTSEMQDIFDYIHVYGYKVQWMPWYKADGYSEWKNLGFDSADMQPNYAMKQPRAGAVLPNVDRLSECAYLCSDLGMNLLMEQVYRYYSDPAQRLNERLYFNHGLDELDGYLKHDMGGWYQDYRIIANYYESGRIEDNMMYDDCFRAVKGTYQRKHISLCHNKQAKINSVIEPKLTDGLWMTRGQRTDRIVQTGDSVTIDIDMELAQPLGDVRLHVTEDTANGFYAPEVISAYVSRDGVNYKYVARRTLTKLLDWQGNKGGFICLNWDTQIGRYLRLEVMGPANKSMGLGEVCVFPSYTALWGVWPEITSGTLETGYNEQDIRKMNDSRIVSQTNTSEQVFFSSGNATLKYTTWDEDIVLGKAWAHVWWTGLTVPSMQALIIDSGGNMFLSAVGTPDADGWICVDLPAAKCTSMRFILSADSSAGWDEFMLQKMENIAKDKPYNITPLYSEVLGDLNRTKLTDGSYDSDSLANLSVGWDSSDVEAKVILELPQIQSVDSIKIFSFEGQTTQVTGQTAAFPNIISVELSNDGENWTDARPAISTKDIVNNPNISGADGTWAWIGVDFTPQSCRFIRLGISRLDNWLIMNEIRILSNSVNLAQGLSYYLMPGPKSSDIYGDIRGILTDSFYIYPYAKAGSWGTVAGWNQGVPEVTVDMLNFKTISAVNVHFVGGGTEFIRGDVGNGAFLPSSVEVLVSSDGITWTQLGLLQGYPLASQITSRLSLRKSLLVQGQSQTARYVKVKMTHYQGWIIVDEIEAFNLN